MKVFSILLVTCLLGLCHCSRSKFPADGLFIEVLDDYPEMETRRSGSSGKRLVWDMAYGIAYGKEGLQNYNSVTDRYLDEEYKLYEDDTAGLSGLKGQTDGTLDLTDPDGSKVDIVKGGNNGVSYKGFMPKPGSKITSVMDAGATVWKSSGDEKCTGGNIYGKDDSLLLDVSITTEDKFNVKYFEKVDGQWSEVALNDFLEKLYEMNKSGIPDTSTQVSEESHSTSKSTIHSQ